MSQENFSEKVKALFQSVNLARKEEASQRDLVDDKFLPREEDLILEIDKFEKQIKQLEYELTIIRKAHSDETSAVPKLEELATNQLINQIRSVISLDLERPYQNQGMGFIGGFLLSDLEAMVVAAKETDLESFLRLNEEVRYRTYRIHTRQHPPIIRPTLDYHQGNPDRWSALLQPEQLNTFLEKLPPVNRIFSEGMDLLKHFSGSDFPPDSSRVPECVEYFAKAQDLLSALEGHYIDPINYSVRFQFLGFMQDKGLHIYAALFRYAFRPHPWIPK